MAKFEAHVTCERAQALEVQRFGELTDWRFSAFDADPMLGDKPYCYLTQYSTDAEVLLVEMHTLVRLLIQAGVVVLREKIERIVYDTKTGVDEIRGG